MARDVASDLGLGEIFTSSHTFRARDVASDLGLGGDFHLKSHIHG